MLGRGQLFHEQWLERLNQGINVLHEVYLSFLYCMQSPHFAPSGEMKTCVQYWWEMRWSHGCVTHISFCDAVAC
jgi:hypothetical protein